MALHFCRSSSNNNESSAKMSAAKLTMLLLLIFLVGLFVSCHNEKETQRDEDRKEADTVAQNRQEEFNRIKNIVDAHGGRIKTSEGDETAITSIDFSNCHTVNSETIAELGKIPTLDSLLLLDTRFDEHGLSHLAQFSNLELLDLKGASISDEGLSNFPPLNDLRFLGLSGTQITDAGLKRIPDLSLPNLKFLQLNFTDTSNEAKEELTKRCPNLKIVL